jgi:hypothetical protein
MILEEDRYRLWYEVVSPEDISAGKAGERNLLCYAESVDTGWNKPSIGIVEYEGNTDNNIVYGGPLAPRWGYHGSTVFRDPSCGEEERYKIIHLGFVGKEVLEEFKKAGHEGVDPLCERGDRASVVFGAVSPDGIHWKALEEPLVLQSSDTQNTAYFDQVLGKYVAYLRTWVLNRRSIGRSESSDFRRLPLPETLVWPGPEVGPSDLWYCNAKTTYPGAGDYHFLFAKRWHVAEDRFYIHLATSPDGIMWGFPPEGQVLGPGPMGGFDAGGVSVGCGMVELPNDRVGVPFVGFAVPHKHPRTRPLGNIAWGSWPRGRLVALKADGVGEFRTMFVTFEGDELRVNARTSQVGEIRFGVLTRGRQEPEGRSLEDCDPVKGDSFDHIVSWGGDTSIGHEQGSPVAFQVRMTSAELFSMSFD